MNIYLQRFIFFIAVFSIVFGCDDDPDCSLELPHDDVELVFYDFESLEETSNVFTEVSLLLDEDSEVDKLVYYTNEDTLSNFPMQVAPSRDSVTYFFGTGVSRDTLTLSYNRELVWISDKCGPFLNYNGLEVIKSTFDSTSLISSVIDASIEENIQIYR